MGVASKLLGWVATAVASLLLLSIIAWFTLPRVLDVEPQVVLSGSMEPALQTGAVAFMKPMVASDMKVGDIMTFRHPEQLGVVVTHRVVGIDAGPDGEPQFTTRGDANDGPDPWFVPASMVLGKVVWDVPHAGRIAERMRSPLGFFVLMVLPAAYLAAGEVRSIVTTVRKHRNAEDSV